MSACRHVLPKFNRGSSLLLLTSKESPFRSSGLTAAVSNKRLMAHRSGGAGGSNGSPVPVGGLADLESIRSSLPPKVAELLQGYPSLITIPVQWGEMDSYKHLNNVHYLRYFESARIAYFDQVIGARMDPERYADFILAKKVGPILKQATLKYLAPVVYPDTLTMGVHVPHDSISKDRFVQSFKAVSHSLGRVVCEGEAVIVTFDYEKNGKADIPHKVVEILKSTHGPPVTSKKHKL